MAVVDGAMLTVLTLLKMHPSPNGEQHGERPFWREFGPRYLDAWLAAVDRYVPRPHRVIVMTDEPQPAPWPVHMAPLDPVVDAPGFWAKMMAFRRGMSSCLTLYLDLDNVVSGDLSKLCALRPDPMIMLDDRRVPRLPNGSAMLFDPERCNFLWDAYAANPREIEDEFAGPRGNDYTRAYDQAFVAESLRATGHQITFFQDMLPPGYILNAASELDGTERWRNAHMVYGSGGHKEGKPHTSSHRFFAEHWA